MVSKRRKADVANRGTSTGIETVSHTPSRGSQSVATSSWSTRVVLSSVIAVAVTVALLALVSPSNVWPIGGSNRGSGGESGGGSGDSGRTDKLAVATAVLMRAAARGELNAARAVIEAVPEVVNTRVRLLHCLSLTPDMNTMLHDPLSSAIPHVCHHALKVAHGISRESENGSGLQHSCDHV